MPIDSMIELYSFYQCSLFVKAAVILLDGCKLLKNKGIFISLQVADNCFSLYSGDRYLGGGLCLR
ncbi:MAG: hypothetical protein K6L73_04630 [Cellvibrionaceae bacterium]